MPTIGSVTKTIRFNPSDLGIIEDIMKKEDTTFNNAVHLLIENGGTPKNQSKIDRGTPKIEEKTEERLVNPRYEEFERLCEVKKQDADKMINNVVRQMGG